MHLIQNRRFSHTKLKYANLHNSEYQILFRSRSENGQVQDRAIGVQGNGHRRPGQPISFHARNSEKIRKSGSFERTRAISHRCAGTRASHKNSGQRILKVDSAPLTSQQNQSKIFCETTTFFNMIGRLLSVSSQSFLTSNSCLLSALC